MSPDPARLDPQQTEGLTDMSPAAFRAAGHAVVDLIADYLEGVESYAVFPAIEPGSIAPNFAAHAPEDPEPVEAILADVQRLVLPNATHWQHPGFFAYFSTSASGPGILGEMITAALGQNPMLWRTSPIGTELEGVVVRWLRESLGLPDGFDGLLTDTASTSTLIAIAASREAAGLDASALGLAGREAFGHPRVYASTEAHSSIEKACMTLGLGRAALVKIPTNARYEMDADALAAAIAADRAAGRTPICIVATVGTTSSTSVDPVAAIADVAEREGLWLHVDSAYAGATALLPDRRAPFAGWERADSIVINAHKWLFTPLDASLLLSRRMDQLRAAFSLVPEYSGTRLNAARSWSMRRLSRSDASSGVNSHLCALITIESARSQPANGARRSGSSAVAPAYAESTWSQRPSRSATSAMAATGSTEVDDVVPTVATMQMGVRPAARSAAMAAARASASISYRALVGILTSAARPSPSVMHAFSMELCASVEA